MEDLSLALLLLAEFLGALWLTGHVRRYALARHLLDIPNERSSHAEATARGGGVAIVLTVLAAFPVLGWNNMLAWQPVWGFLGGGALVALVGFVDDHGHVPASWRLLGHFAASAWIMAWFGGLPPLPVLGLVLDLNWLGYILAAVYLVWLLNLTNFMDGIDGIAGVEAITVCLGGVLLCAVTVPDWKCGVAPLVLAVATLGFLMWNWPPARIFMGDAGSGFLGFMLGAFSLQAGWLAPALFWSWTILLGVFVVDSTVTLIRRVLRGDTFYQAHRSHAYQHAALRCRAHRPVILTIGAINLAWLFPIALVVALEYVDGVLGVVVAYAPLLALATHFKAGETESEFS